MIKCKVKKLSEHAQLPTFGSELAACFDIRCTEAGTVPPGQSQVFRTGLAFEIPEGHVMRLYSRSGHGFSHGVRLANVVGIIDSDYRGEVMVKLHNDSNLSYPVSAGERIVQGEIVACTAVDFEQVDELSNTARGTGGLGSSGRV